MRIAETCDFPAAHSMDTDWFAVDEDGNVARFESGEAGAIPLQAPMGPGPSDATFDYTLVEALELARVIASGKDPFTREEPPPPEGPPYRTPGRSPRVPLRPTEFPARLLLVVDGELPKSLVDEGQLIAVRSQPPGVYLTADKVKRADWPRYEAIPGLRDALSANHLYEFTDPEDYGCFFQYSNEDYGAPGAYERTVVPERPMRLDELPQILRDEFKKVRLPVKFGDQESLQLADYLKDEEAAIWGDCTLRGEPLPPAAIEARRPKAPALRAAGIVGIGIFLLLFLMALAQNCHR